VTVTVGIGAPEASVTVPFMLSETCAPAPGKYIGPRKSATTARYVKKLLVRSARRLLWTRDFRYGTMDPFKLMASSSIRISSDLRRTLNSIHLVPLSQIDLIRIDCRR